MLIEDGALDAEAIYARVWRFDFDQPGFWVLDVDASVDSHRLRSRMVTLKRALSDLNQARTGKPFRFRTLARFDQQVTTKHHVDGAPPEALLMLGYEPSRVHSRLFLTDYSRAAFDLGITPQQFLHDFNPMFRKGEEILDRYTTELAQPQPGTSRILLINNSSLPFTPERLHPLGVMHKAIIVTPDDRERRIINSAMLMTEEGELSPEVQEEFLRTDQISPKNQG